ncbi:hypothetical protein [Candidatus Bathycorpusculum sp.]|nr:hypothetical protein [Candidatus Termitimicrobium sp.]MCL2685717.1 hypothetical protein [Candidatus Termitimicrobium sp.]
MSEVEVAGFLERVVTPLGTLLKLMCQKDTLNMSYIVITKIKDEDKEE